MSKINDLVTVLVSRAFILLPIDRERYELAGYLEAEAEAGENPHQPTLFEWPEDISFLGVGICNEITEASQAFILVAEKIPVNNTQRRLAASVKHSLHGQFTASQYSKIFFDLEVGAIESFLLRRVATMLRLRKEYIGTTVLKGRGGNP